jgi:hypothetical protein
MHRHCPLPRCGHRCSCRRSRHCAAVAAAPAPAAVGCTGWPWPPSSLGPYRCIHFAVMPTRLMCLPACLPACPPARPPARLPTSSPADCHLQVTGSVRPGCGRPGSGGSWRRCKWAARILPAGWCCQRPACMGSPGVGRGGAGGPGSLPACSGEEPISSQVDTPQAPHHAPAHAHACECLWICLPAAAPKQHACHLPLLALACPPPCAVCRARSTWLLQRLKSSSHPSLCGLLAWRGCCWVERS